MTTWGSQLRSLPLDDVSPASFTLCSTRAACSTSEDPLSGIHTRAPSEAAKPAFASCGLAPDAPAIASSTDATETTSFCLPSRGRLRPIRGISHAQLSPPKGERTIFSIQQAETLMYDTSDMIVHMTPTIAKRWLTREEAEATYFAEDSEARQLAYSSTIPATIGIAVLKYRYDYSLSQTAFGKLVGMSQPQVARLELGEHTPNFDTLLRITAATGLEISLTIGPTVEPRRAIPKELQRDSVCDATDQVLISVREAR